MTLYKDSNNKIHDDDDGKALHLLPSNSIQITNEEAEVIRVSQLPIIDPQIAINQEALAYLASTDWYVVRYYETGVIIPDDTKLKRAEARLVIV